MKKEHVVINKQNIFFNKRRNLKIKNLLAIRYTNNDNDYVREIRAYTSR